MTIIARVKIIIFVFHLANFLHITEMMEEIGPALGHPYTRPLKQGLFEIRARGLGKMWRIKFLSESGNLKGFGIAENVKIISFADYKRYRGWFFLSLHPLHHQAV